MLTVLLIRRVFYPSRVCCSKKFLLNEDVVELSGLGLAVTTVVTVAEILRASGHVEIERELCALSLLAIARIFPACV